MKRSEITIDGKNYSSRSEAARALVKQGKGLAEIAHILGITYQSVYAVTVGADKVAERRVKYRAMRLATSPRCYSLDYIHKKTGLRTTELKKLFKVNNVIPTCVQKEHPEEVPMGCRLCHKYRHQLEQHQKKHEKEHHHHSKTK